MSFDKDIGHLREHFIIILNGPGSVAALCACLFAKGKKNYGIIQIKKRQKSGGFYYETIGTRF